MVNTSLASIASLTVGWLLAQSTVAHGVNWEIIISAVLLVLTILGVAWKGGLLQGGSVAREQALMAKMEALSGELAACKVEVHQLRNDLGKVRDTTVVNENNVQHLLAFKQEFTQTMKAVERELLRRPTRADSGEGSRYGG